MKNSIEFRLKPIDSEIEKVGEKGESFLKSHGLSDRNIRAQLMVIKELINSGKTFESHRPAGNEMSVHIFVEKDTIITEIRKPVTESADDHQLQALDKTIQWIRGYQDPFAPYMAIACRTSGAVGEDGSNSFGLAKIAYEAGAILDFYVSEDNILNLSAVSHLNGDY